MKKLVRVFVLVLAGVLALVVLLLACGSLFGGRVASSYLNGHGEELVGRRVTVERVGLNLFRKNRQHHPMQRCFLPALPGSCLAAIL